MHQAVKQLLEVNLGADTYRIAGKFGEDFNLAIWRIVKIRLIKFSSITPMCTSARYVYGNNMCMVRLVPPSLPEEGLSRNADLQ